MDCLAGGLWAEQQCCMNRACCARAKTEHSTVSSCQDALVRSRHWACLTLASHTVIGLLRIGVSVFVIWPLSPQAHGRARAQWSTGKLVPLVLDDDISVGAWASVTVTVSLLCITVSGTLDAAHVRRGRGATCHVKTNRFSVTITHRHRHVSCRHGTTICN